MKLDTIRDIVGNTAQRVPAEIQALIEKLAAPKGKAKAAPAVERLVAAAVPPDRIAKRASHLGDEGRRPSFSEQERILGTNDLVDLNYLARGLRAARSVCRVVLREASGREVGYGTGFQVAPGLLMTNHHVLRVAADAEHALAEFDYELDIMGFPKTPVRFALLPDTYYYAYRGLDFAIVAIAPTSRRGNHSLEEFGYLRLNPSVGKVNPGESVTLIQHPSGQPKQLAIRENDLIKIEEQVLWYRSDTAPGSSGSPVLNDSWQIVGLHHSGVPRKDAQGNWLLRNGQPAGADADDSEIDWIANEGIRASRIVKWVEGNAPDHPLKTKFLKVTAGELAERAAAPGSDQRGATPGGRPSAFTVEDLPGGARVTVPISFRVAVEGMRDLVREEAEAEEPEPAPLTEAEERLKYVFVDPDYDNRGGYDERYLGVKVPMPTVRSPSKVAKMDDGKHVIPYEHFSVVMDKKRRLPLLTASNVDAKPSRKRPEAGRDYSRKGLGGLGPNDREKWRTDPRIPEVHQLPDLFYTGDRGAFDKGHVVRRDDVAWGRDYDEVRRANGDTFHTTNCTPQVDDFNRSNLGGVWGKLENEILKQAKSERCCVFSGPLMTDDDEEFVGKDDRGETRVKIPSRYWKVIVANTDDELQSFGFILEQDLQDVPLELAFQQAWVPFMVPISEIEQRVGNLRFRSAIKDADQHDNAAGESVVNAAELAGVRKRAHPYEAAEGLAEAH